MDYAISDNRFFGGEAKNMSSDIAAQQKFRGSFETFKGTVYAAAFSCMKNQADANDVLQEVFLKFYQHMDEIDDSAIRSWLLTVTYNTCKTIKKSGWFSRTFFSDDIDEISYEENFGEESDLFVHVMRLPDKERIPLHLFYYEGCSVAEISKLLKINESTIRVRIMRGREHLKAFLKEGSI